MQTHPLKSMQSPETSAHKAKPHGAPATENFLHPRSQLWWKGVFPPLPHHARRGWSLHWPDFLAGWPVPLAQEVLHNFSQTSNQTRLKKGCCSQHPMRHRPSVCSPVAGASPAVVPRKVSPDLERQRWVISCLLKGLLLHARPGILSTDPHTFGEAITQSMPLQRSYCQRLHRQGRTMFRLKATVLLLN